MTVTLGITGFLDCLMNTMFWKMDLFPSSEEGVGDTNSVGPLERANLNHWTTTAIYL
jgi:hypothetical protein